MGGPYTMFTAAAVPERVRAAGSFHGGNLVTDKPDSPHLLAAKIKAAVSRLRPMTISDSLTRRTNCATFAGAAQPVKLEAYQGCQHGWCVTLAWFTTRPRLTARSAS
jgi:carboxymethylenebutenolidase